ncbi:MAG: hypothetical protein B7X34_05945 [Acidobacteriia bacterium 12-62-4]|nr:MAG: hypothetical protein B7X34_05945 [Acidobacteriia bacterium 12-62-4]
MRLAPLVFALAWPLAAQELEKLFEQEWERSLRISPVFASTMGDRRYAQRWPDLSPAALARDYGDTKAALARLRSLPPTPAQAVNRAIFERMLSEQIEEYELGWRFVPVNMRDGIQNTADVANLLNFREERDYQDWLARLRAFPVYMDQTIALMREGMRRKLVQPKIVMQRVPAQIERQLQSNPFTAPFATQSTTLRNEAKLVIETAVFPALRKFKLFLETEYLPACYDGVGIWQAPEGEKLYAYFARSFTTTGLTPDEIHAIGLREVARIRDEMYSVQRKVGFAGPLPEFFQYLRTEPRFYYATGAELLDGYRAMAKRIDPTLVKLFRKLPRTPYGVEPIPAEIAPDTTAAYYQPPAGDGSRAGMYHVNLYKPEMRPKWEMMALSLHESVPGHHTQIAYAQEMGEVPKFRRFQAGFTAYVEGWALYAESLGDELGLYDDPYAKFGQLTYEMWRAVRLVVDTGIHHKRWSRQQAIDYFLANAPKTELDVTNEIDRYIGWPGQALGYKIGELKMKELRRRAQEKLGARFDVRAFHDVVLSTGAVPLDVLEKRVMDWVDGN